jgi:enoyl-CoA hydratase
MTTPDILLIDVSDRIGTITLNRPESRNALSVALAKRIREAVAELDASADVDVLILTGTDPAFCAGVDLKELGSGSKSVAAVDRSKDPTAEPMYPWAPTVKPLLGAINGVAITGGFELALQCDFLIASERCAFGDTHTRVGILPGWGLSVLLPQAIGYRRAVEMSMTGNFMFADEALNVGLVNHVVAHKELIPFTRKLAADIVSNNQDGLQELLASYRAIHRMTVGDGERHEAIVGRAWSQRTFDPHVFEARRAGILDRGRKQT